MRDIYLFAILGIIVVVAGVLTYHNNITGDQFIQIVMAIIGFITGYKANEFKEVIDKYLGGEKYKRKSNVDGGFMYFKGKDNNIS